MDLAGMKVVVCGAGGFIGGHLVRSLINQGIAVRAVDLKPTSLWHQLSPRAENLVLDLNHPPNCAHAVEGMTAVFQLAADMGGMGFIERNRARCMLSVLINANMIKAAQEAGVRRYFYSSSACIYNTEMQTTPEVVPLREDQAWPARPEKGYGHEKLFSEELCAAFHHDFGFVSRVARYHNVYGPYGTWIGGREKAPAAICRKVLDAKYSGRKHIEIWGDGNQTRSFMYIDDCIEGTLRLFSSNVNEPLNIGSSELVSINQLVDMVEEIAGLTLERRYNLGAPKGVNGRNSDNTLIRQALHWEPSIKLRDGLAKTYAWIESAYLAHTRSRSFPHPEQVQVLPIPLHPHPEPVQLSEPLAIHAEPLPTPAWLRVRTDPRPTPEPQSIRPEPPPPSEYHSRMHAEHPQASSHREGREEAALHRPVRLDLPIRAVPRPHLVTQEVLSATPLRLQAQHPSPASNRSRSRP